jgi:hypothetical protein
MSASLGDALRLLGLPLDEVIDEQRLVGAYRDAARAHHPDAVPEELRAVQTERMREINVARDLIKNHLGRLAEEPFASAYEDGSGVEPDAWWNVGAEDLSELGVRWNPAVQRIPWARRVNAARLALGIVVGDQVSIDENGILTLGRVTAFDESTRVGLRTTFQGIPVEVRRVGLEVEQNGSKRIVDAADVQAAGWRCPVCLRTSPHGLPRERPCPRCLRRFRSGFDRWKDAAISRRRLRRRLARLTSEPAPFAPRRYPAYREAETQLDDARSRRDSLETTRGALQAALDEAVEAEQLAATREARARSEAGVERRARERRQHAAEAKRAQAALAAIDAELEQASERIAALATELARLERELEIRHTASERAREAGESRRVEERARVERELREVELELAALNPDAPVLLDAFESWGELPERWLSG